MNKDKNKSGVESKILLGSKILFILLVLISVVLFEIVISLKVVPIKMIAPVLIFYILVCTGIGFGIVSKSKLWVKLLMDFFSLVLIIGCSAALYYLNTTLNFMDRIKPKGYQTENYYVLVKSDSSYNRILDIKDSDMAIYDSPVANYSKALEDINSMVEVNEKSYSDYLSASQALIDKEVDSLLISAAYKDLVSDEIKDFENSVRVLYTVTLKIDSNIDTIDVDVTDKPFNIYISGIDIYGDITSVSRSDVNMIVTVNPKTHKVLLTSIPRDYYVQLHGTTGYKDKLTHAGIYGIDMSINTIEDLLDIDINYYIRVNFTTLINLVDAIGGIDIYSDASFTAWTNKSCKFNVGTQHLDGKCALAFARERYAYKTGDRHRVQNQQAVLTAIIDKTLSSSTLVTKYSKILDSMGSSFQTSIPSSKIYSLVNKQLDSMPSWKIENYSLNGTDHKDYTYSSKGSRLLYVMLPDMKTVEEARLKIDNIERGL